MYNDLFGIVVKSVVWGILSGIVVCVDYVVVVVF